MPEVMASNDALLFTTALVLGVLGGGGFLGWHVFVVFVNINVSGLVSGGGVVVFAVIGGDGGFSCCLKKVALRLRGCEHKVVTGLNHALTSSSLHLFLDLKV